MLDFSFGELAIIGAVALVVLGPERLPKVARTAGQWVSKAQRYVNDVKADIQRESEMAELRKLQQDVQQSAKDLENSVHQSLDSLASEVKVAESAAVARDAGSVPAYDGYLTQGEFVKAPPTLEELAARLETMQTQIGFSRGARFKYAPRARSQTRTAWARRRNTGRANA